MCFWCGSIQTELKKKPEKIPKKWEMLRQTTTPTLYVLVQYWLTANTNVTKHSNCQRLFSHSLSSTYEWNEQNTNTTTDRISQRKLVHFRWCTAKRCAIKKKFYFHSWRTSTLLTDQEGAILCLYALNFDIFRFVFLSFCHCDVFLFDSIWQFTGEYTHKTNSSWEHCQHWNWNFLFFQTKQQQCAYEIIFIWFGFSLWIR